MSWGYALLECFCGLDLNPPGRTKRKGPEYSSCPKKNNKRKACAECLDIGANKRKRGHMCKAFSWADLTSEFKDTGAESFMHAVQAAQDDTFEKVRDLISAESPDKKGV